MPYRLDVEDFEEAVSSGVEKLKETHAAKGEVAESLRAYERCRMMLQDEFGVAPGREVEQFASRVKAAPR